MEVLLQMTNDNNLPHNSPLDGRYVDVGSGGSLGLRLSLGIHTITIYTIRW